MKACRNSFIKKLCCFIDLFERKARKDFIPYYIYKFAKALTLSKSVKFENLEVTDLLF